MATFLSLKRIGVHQFACLALYRALLRQTTRVPIEVERQRALKKFVGKSFRRNKRVLSHKLLQKGFEAGYEALDLLRRSASGNAGSTTRILTLLSALCPPTKLRARTHNEPPAAQQQQPPSAAPAPKPKALRPAREKDRDRRPATTLPSTGSIFDRPRPRVSGIRRVPRLVSANGTPFLRIKKPQPASLTHILVYKRRQKQRWTDLIADFQHRLIAARLEDTWDAHVSRICGLSAADDPPGEESPLDEKAGAKQEPPPLWAHEIRQGLNWLNRRTYADDRQKAQLAARLYEIVKKERALAQQEKLERRNQRLKDRRGRDPEGFGFEAPASPPYL